MSQTHRITEPTQLGQLVRQARRAQRLTQGDLALAAGLSRRFVIELERGKSTCQLGKALHLLRILGIGVLLEPPPTGAAE
ncbi:MAG: helix-turn-helix transcriptional regulator [Thermoanaerobaculia bacterium]|nr:helix-turn-helix transcriptional regulator [Thermoanaerobaculia bacterium]